MENHAVNYISKKLEDVESELKACKESLVYWRNMALDGKTKEEQEEILKEATDLMILL